MYIKERNIVVAVILSIVTLGIYSYYWIYKLNEETNEITAEPYGQRVDGAMLILFSIITCGIYTVYWSYKQGEKFQRFYNQQGSHDADDAPVIYLILEIAKYFVGVTSIINYCLQQDRINKIINATAMAGGSQGNYGGYSQGNGYGGQGGTNAYGQANVYQQPPVNQASTYNRPMTVEDYMGGSPNVVGVAGADVAGASMGAAQETAEAAAQEPVQAVNQETVQEEGPIINLD